MNENGLARRLAFILVGGHIILFLFGLIVAVFGRLTITDSIQMILMGSPLLAVVAVSAFSHILQGRAIQDNGPDVDRGVSIFLQIVVFAFLGALFIIYAMGLFETGNFANADTIKILVGSVETVLGGYIALIKDKIFVAERINEAE